MAQLIAAGRPPCASCAHGLRVPSRAAARAGATSAPSTGHTSPLVHEHERMLLPRAREALAGAERLDGVGWVFAPPAGLSSGVAVMFYPGGVVDVESYAVLATHLAGLGHAVVLIAFSDQTYLREGESAVSDKTGALASAAAAAARTTLGLPLEKIVLAGHSAGGNAAMQALNASQSGVQGRVR